MASGPITPMEEATWDHMVQLLRPSLKDGGRMREILAELHEEVTSGYEDTLRKLVGGHTHESLGCCVDWWTNSDVNLFWPLLLLPLSSATDTCEA